MRCSLVLAKIILAKTPTRPQRPNTFWPKIGQKGSVVWGDDQATALPFGEIPDWGTVFFGFFLEKTPKTPKRGQKGVLRRGRYATPVFFRFAKKQKGTIKSRSRSLGPFFSAFGRKKYTVLPFWPYSVQKCFAFLYFSLFGPF